MKYTFFFQHFVASSTPVSFLINIQSFDRLMDDSSIENGKGEKLVVRNQADGTLLIGRCATNMEEHSLQQQGIQMLHMTKLWINLSSTSLG